MAAPAVQGTVSHAETTSNNGFTGSEPAGAASGELMVFVVMVEQAVTDFELDNPLQWTKVFSRASAGGDFYGRVYVGFRGSSALNYKVNWASGSPAYYEYALFRVSGVSQVTPLDSAAYGEHFTGSGTDMQGPSVQARGSDTLTLSVYLTWTGYAGSAPTGYTLVIGGSDIQVASKAETSAGLRPRQVWTGSGSNGNDKETVTFALSSTDVGAGFNALSIPAVDADCRMERNSSIPSLDSVTWTGWVYIPAYGDWGSAIAIEGNTNGEYFFLEFNAAGQLYLITRNGLAFASQQTFIWTDGRTGWHFLAVWGNAVSRGASFLAEGETTFTTVSDTWNSTPFTPTKMTIGGEQNYLGDGDFEIRLAGVCIYGVELEQAEMLEQAFSRDFSPVRTTDLLFANDMQGTVQPNVDQSGTGDFAFPQYWPSFMYGYAPSVTPYASLRRYEAAASSVEGGGFEPALAIDGEEGTRWSSLTGDPQWLIVDLRYVYEMTKFVILWEVAASSDYDVQSSYDAVTWTTVVTHTSSTPGDRTDSLTGLSGLGRYIRMYSRSRVNPVIDETSLYEIYAYGSVGLSPYEIVEAVANTWFSGFEPWKAADGDFETRWSSHWEDPSWIYFDMGQIQEVGAVMIDWETAASADYDIDVSDDALAWTTVATKTGVSGPRTDWVTFPGRSARYVRMYSRARTTAFGNSIYEFRIFEPVDVPFEGGKGNAEEGIFFLPFQF